MSHNINIILLRTGLHITWGLFLYKCYLLYLDAVVYACNTCGMGQEEGGWVYELLGLHGWILGQSQLHCETLYQQRKQNNNNNKTKIKEVLVVWGLWWIKAIFYMLYDTDDDLTNMSSL